jgi:hypothetical protein
MYLPFGVEGSVNVYCTSHFAWKSTWDVCFLFWGFQSHKWALTFQVSWERAEVCVCVCVCFIFKWVWWKLACCYRSVYLCLLLAVYLNELCGFFCDKTLRNGGDLRSSVSIVNIIFCWMLLRCFWNLCSSSLPWGQATKAPMYLTQWADFYVELQLVPVAWNSPCRNWPWLEQGVNPWHVCLSCHEIAHCVVSRLIWNLVGTGIWCLLQNVYPIVVDIYFTTD